MPVVPAAVAPAVAPVVPAAVAPAIAPVVPTAVAPARYAEIQPLRLLDVRIARLAVRLLRDDLRDGAADRLQTRGNISFGGRRHRLCGSRCQSAGRPQRAKRQQRGESFDQTTRYNHASTHPIPYLD